MLSNNVNVPKNINKEKRDRKGRIISQAVASIEVLGRVITKPIQEMHRIRMVAAINAPTRPKYNLNRLIG